HVIEEIDEEDRSTRFTYDARYLRTRRTDALDGQFSWKYDANGNVVQEIDEEGRQTAYVFDRQDRLTDKNQPHEHNTHYEHDANGNIKREVDPWGFAIAREYDALDHVRQITDPDGKTEQSYNAAGKLVYEKNAGDQVRTTLFDALGRPIEE